jgi:hypothetical protein
MFCPYTLSLSTLELIKGASVLVKRILPLSLTQWVKISETSIYELDFLATLAPYL